jgi:DnaJ-class molecular chaperone
MWLKPNSVAETVLMLAGVFRLGHLDPHGQQSDLTFIVQQQLHPAFRRLADDLYAIVNVPLVTGKL